MILAAGLGTRLGPLGESNPKALIDVGGATMLEHVSASLVAAGADRIIINVHHRAELITRFLDTHDLGVEVLVSFERDRPLETGGGLLHAKRLFRRDGPFFLHNVDVLTDADLRSLLQSHQQSDAIATLAVNDRTTSRHLLFDESGLIGRDDTRRDTRTTVRPARGPVRAFAFAGIHVISPGFLDRITETGAFSILVPYLRLASAGAHIAPSHLGSANWLEIGSPERLEDARRRISSLRERSVEG